MAAAGYRAMAVPRHGRLRSILLNVFNLLIFIVLILISSTVAKPLGCKLADGAVKIGCRHHIRRRTYEINYIVS
jgi:hypothetical protein